MTAVDSLFKELVVIEVANVLAGPAVGMFFAELGATVIKVENPSTDGDTTRKWKLPGESEETDVSGYFSCVNWGKKSIGLDFTRPEGRQVLMDLVGKADIFLQSFKHGDDIKFKLDYPTLKAVNPALIYADITAYGPDDDRPGFDAVLQAESGFTGMNGNPDGGPVKMPVALIDLLLAHQLKEAILLALIERLQKGNGSYVTISLLDSGITSLANQAANFLVGKTVPRRSGSEHPNIVPYGTIFRSGDGEDLVLAVGTDAQFRALCEVLEMSCLAVDVRFSTNPRRVENRTILNQTLAESISTHDRDELLEALHRKRVPAGPVRMMDEVMALPQVDSLKLTGQLPDGNVLQGLRTVAFQSTVHETLDKLDSPPAFNRDQEEILTKFLLYSPSRITKLRDSGAID